MPQHYPCCNIATFSDLDNNFKPHLGRSVPEARNSLGVGLVQVRGKGAAQGGGQAGGDRQTVAHRRPRAQAGAGHQDYPLEQAWNTKF